MTTPEFETIREGAVRRFFFYAKYRHQVLNDFLKEIHEKDPELFQQIFAYVIPPYRFGPYSIEHPNALALFSTQNDFLLARFIVGRGTEIMIEAAHALPSLSLVDLINQIERGSGYGLRSADYVVRECVKILAQRADLSTVIDYLDPGIAKEISSSKGVRSEMRNMPPVVIEEHQSSSVVIIDSNAFFALSKPQQAEFYKLFTARSEVRFVFNLDSHGQQPAVLDELRGFDQRLQNVEIRMSPSISGFSGRKVIHVTKEGLPSGLAQELETQLRRSKHFYPVRYPKTASEPGLLTAALLLLDSGREDLMRQRQFFSEIPAALRSEIRQFLESYVYIARSA